MVALLMNALQRAVHRAWPQGGAALHPDPRPKLREALRDTDLAAAHTVTQVTRDAERMESPHFRTRLHLRHKRRR